MKLDALDHRILDRLSRDPRLGASEIARSVAHGRDIVAYRLSRLSDLGLISGAAALLNPFALGFGLYKTYLRLRRHRPARLKSLVAALRAHPRTFCLAQCEGGWDIIFNAVSETAERFDQIQDRLLTSFRDIVIESDFAVVTRHQTIVRAPARQECLNSLVLAGSVRSPGDPERQDLAILDALCKDCRTPISRIAESSGLHPQTVQRRIAHFERSGLIAGYRLELDRSLLSQQTFKLQLFLSSFSATTSRRLRQFCERHAAVYKLLQQLGACKYELGVAAGNYEEFLVCLDDLRRELRESLRESKGLLVRNEEYLWHSRGVSSLFAAG